MSDAVSKNLSVPDGVAESLGSTHVPHSLLCKAHTCEKFDECNVSSLMNVEKDIGLRDVIEKREPRLKSFVRQSKSIVCKAVINALLSLVATGGDGKSASLADEFSLILEEDNVHKKYSLYKERRFTKLGYTAASIYECLPQFRKLLKRTSKKNLLVRACKLYIESDYILAALKALGNFTYLVTMPFLNAVEKCNQNELVDLLPKLYEDLNTGIADSLKDYKVDWKHVDMSKLAPSSELDKFLLDKMFKDAAQGLKLQCSREYWEDSDKPRATQIFKMRPEERKNLPTENIEAERYMSKVGALASQSAAHSNQFFKAKRMRDDLMFGNQVNAVTDHGAKWSKSEKEVFKKLDTMETGWTKQQRKEYKKKLAKVKLQDDNRHKFIDLVLQKCKSHGGPLTTVEELNKLINEKLSEKDLKAALRLEMQYRKFVSIKDAESRPELYKVNGVTIDEFVMNLSLILTDSLDNNSPSDVLFYTEDEILDALKKKADESDNQYPSLDIPILKTNELIAVVWDGKKGRKWCLGFYLDHSSDKTFRVDHLKRLRKKSSSKWRRPVMDDIQDVSNDQVVLCNVYGDWVFENDISIFILANEDEINQAFSSFTFET